MTRESIRARVAAATPGPWYAETADELLMCRVGVEGHLRGVGDYAIAFFDGSVRPEPGSDEDDATFIAHARADIERLLAVADAAVTLLAQVPTDPPEGDPSDWGWVVPMTAVLCLRGALDALEATE